MTEVNGFILKNAIKKQEVLRNMLKSKFDDSLYAFPDEEKLDPNAVMARYHDAERTIATLQTAQAEYNGIAKTKGGLTITEAVKTIGGYVRISAMWRQAAQSESRGLFGLSSRRRSKEEEQATKQIKDDVAFENYALSEGIVNDLRAAIAEANATMVDIAWLNQDLLDSSS